MAPHGQSRANKKMALFARANANTTLLTNNCYLLKLTSHDAMLRGIASYTTKISGARRYSKCPCLVRFFNRCNLTSNTQKTFFRKCHVVPHNPEYVPFEELMARRRQEAGRSIVVQVQSSNSSKELFAHCEQFGAVSGMHHYTPKEALHFYLIEFNETSSAKAALASATHVNVDEVIPVQSPILWFRNTRSSTSLTASRDTKSENKGLPLITTDGARIPTVREITERLEAAESISDQMIVLHKAWKLDEVGIRLRFLTAHQLERIFVGLFPHIAVFPFGSSVNGFGKHGCDLDLVLTLENNRIEKLSSRFVFHTKSISSDSKTQSKRLMETIADSMQHFLPGVTNVRRILQARVPIIKYDHALTGLECDLSMTNMTAVYMSELLCLYGELDWRVGPLVFTVRQWAKSVGLTNASPGRWITNFSITLLVLFYLQQRGILPSVNALKNLADKTDVRITDHSVDCTFLRDVTKMSTSTITANTESLETLLRGFFGLYSSFDFPARAISLREGASIFKPDFSPLYICNPLETNLNVSKNVSAEETERLKLALRNASWIMETGNEKRGLLSIFEQSLDIVGYVAGRRKVNVAALFQMPVDVSTTSSMGKKSPGEEIVKNDPNSGASRNFRMKKGRVRRG